MYGTLHEPVRYCPSGHVYVQSKLEEDEDDELWLLDDELEDEEWLLDDEWDDEELDELAAGSVQ